MRNLYSRLKVSSAASVEEIRSAIAACENASVRSDATEVLLSEDRRRSYDRLHKVLVEIGQLRASLGLSHGDNWRGEAATDYTRPAVPPRQSRYAEFTAKVENHAGRRVQQPTEGGHDAPRTKGTEGGRRWRGRHRRRGCRNLAKSVWELSVGLVKAAAILAAAGAGLWIVGTILEDNRRSERTAKPAAMAAPATPAFAAPPVATPYNGAIRRFAPGEAVTQLGS